MSIAAAYRGEARRAARGQPYDRPLLRVFDVAIAIAALLFLLPLFLTIALFLACQGGPVLIAQRRVGMGGQAFYCFKFRSMVVDAEERLVHLLRDDAGARAEWLQSHKLRADPRATRFGRFLRRSSLDELPQFFNVLRGEMSMVGPRPIVEAEVARYGRRIASYCRVRPGITGIWQVSGRSDIDSAGASPWIASMRNP